jgi:hypothetical protein
MRSSDVFENKPTPKYARAGNTLYYYWDHKPYSRVTSVLGLIVGNSLLEWYAKMGAMRAARPLYEAGLCTSATLEELEEMELYAGYHGFRDASMLSQDDAIAEAFNWKSNMREPMRYRDMRADIGSICHHAHYEIACGLTNFSTNGMGDKKIVQYLADLALGKNRFIREDVLERYAALGTPKTRDDLALDLAYRALPRVKRVQAAIDAFKPEYEMVGAEAMTVNTDEDVAGTMDWIAWFKKVDWQTQCAWPFGERQKIRVMGDDKFTRKAPTSVRYQMAVYARGSFIGDPDTGEKHDIPECDALVCWHLEPPDLKDCVSNLQAIPKVWYDAKLKDGTILTGPDTIDYFYEAFCFLNAFRRFTEDLPRAKSSRVYREPKPCTKLGERPSPFTKGSK